MKCKKCGKKLKRGEKFCISCGYYNSDEDNKELYDQNEESLLDNDYFESSDEIEIIEDDDDDDYSDDNDDLDNGDDIDNHFKEIQKEVAVENKKNKNFQKKFIAKSDKDNEYYGEDEDLIESYIGEDYKIIKKMPFNIYSFIFNWLYLLYRKLYITGSIGLIITLLFIVFLNDYLIVYIGIIMIILGFLFNKYYIFICKKRIENIKIKYEGSDRFNLNSICKEKGGVNYIYALLIYFVFLALVILIIAPFNFSFNSKHNTKYWKVNAENKATCTSLTKVAYNDITSRKNNYNITEGICKKLKTSNDYEIYLKITDSNSSTNQTIYAYYRTKNDYLTFKMSTEEKNNLITKKANNKITIEEQQQLTEMTEIEKNYLQIYNNSKQEDKLIENKDDKDQKYNFVFSKDELLR